MLTRDALARAAVGLRTHHGVVCLPLSLLLLLPVPGLLLAAAVTELSAHGPLGVVAALVLLWALWRGCVGVMRTTLTWWRRPARPRPPHPPDVEVPLTPRELPLSGLPPGPSAPSR